MRAAALGAPDRTLRFVVPTGNFGDAFAGFAAQQLGLPIERIVVATNANDILARALETGRYERGPVHATQSPAMDIQVASNFERLYFEAGRRDAVETGRAFRAFSETGAMDLPPRSLDFMRERFAGVTVGEAETASTMLSTLNETGELVDPHTAVGIAAARKVAVGPRQGAEMAPTIVLSTAHPAKFPDAVRAATGDWPALHVRSRGLAEKTERIDRLPADVAAVSDYVRAFVRATA